MKIQTFVFGPFQENTYVLSDQQNNAILIDPGNSQNQETNRLKEYLKENALNIREIWLTHGHIDHILGLQWAYDTFGVPVRVHPNEKEILERASDSAQMFGFNFPSLEVEYDFLKENERLTFNQKEVEVFHTPGHSPGSVSFYFKEESALISGDVLFYRSIGRTDLYLGDTEMLLQSIRTHLFSLPENTRVYPGHGRPTEIGIEKNENPFLK